MKGNTIKNYFKSSFEELTKVVWPTRNQAVRLTVIVLIFTLIIALFLGFFDFLFSEVYNFVLNLNA